MVRRILNRIFDSNEKQINKLKPVIEKINQLEGGLGRLPDEEIKKKSLELKDKVQKTPQNKQNKVLEEILPEAYALVRESAKRTIGERHYDVQLMAAIVLHQGRIAEQKTGEGKTLSVTMPLYLNSLKGQGCHLVTPNDYLSRIGCGWMGPIYHFLGVSSAVIIHDQAFTYDPDYTDEKATDDRLAHLRPISRQEAYQCEVTYGTNNEFGFDYLRDNMVWELSQMVQTNPKGDWGKHHYAIVDEVDSILIDEARTPLIISAPAEESTDKYYQFSKLVSKLEKEKDYTTEEKNKSAALTEEGIAKLERWLNVDNLYEKDFQTLHHIEEALRANTMYKKDVDYVVKDDQVVIVDEFTGRLMFGRRYSEGLHQAIEAKEGVEIQKESQTLATISFQNYFRMYDKLAGMTGTAVTEAEEFHKIYELEVVVVPTNKPMIRKDYPDLIYKTQEAKYQAVIEEIERKHKIGQPVLVGTVSIEKNELVSEFLERKGIPHQLLNAKHHEKEALILAQAGQKGMVTVATNMAGRGVDIELGGKSPDKNSPEHSEWEKKHQEILELGGLSVLGTERHEARRIDNQLRGRSGRQGDPGMSRFYVSLEDDLMRLFGGDRIKSLMSTLKIPDDIPIENRVVSRSIESSQNKVEGHNFDLRKHLVEYDDVMNRQREIIYQFRRKALEVAETEELDGEEISLKEKIQEKLKEQVINLVSFNLEEDRVNYEKLMEDFITIIPFDENSQKVLGAELENLKETEKIEEKLTEVAGRVYLAREKSLGEKQMRHVEKFVTLSTIDNLWQEHLDTVDDLRQGIGLRGYGQRDPLVEYKNEAFLLFERLMSEIDYQIVRRIFKVGAPQEKRAPRQIQAEHQDGVIGPVRTAVVGDQASPAERVDASKVIKAPVVKKKKIGRNDPCWCGSGKKWKKCHYPDRG